MLIELHLDISSIPRGIVAHGCNCRGKMGRGAALAIRRAHPQAYSEYLEFLKLNSAPLGRVNIVPISNELLIANCFTQLNYGTRGVYADINAVERCLRLCAGLANSLDLPLFTAKLGCNLGGLKWTVVSTLMSRVSEDHNCDIYVCVPK